MTTSHLILKLFLLALPLSVSLSPAPSCSLFSSSPTFLTLTSIFVSAFPAFITVSNPSFDLYTSSVTNVCTFYSDSPSIFSPWIVSPPNAAICQSNAPDSPSDPSHLITNSYVLSLEGGGQGVGSTKISQSLTGFIVGRQYQIEFTYGVPTQMPIASTGGINEAELITRMTHTVAFNHSSTILTTIWSDRIPNIPTPSFPYTRYTSSSLYIPDLDLGPNDSVEFSIETGTQYNPYNILIDDIQVIDATQIDIPTSSTATNPPVSSPPVGSASQGSPGSSLPTDTGIVTPDNTSTVTPTDPGTETVGPLTGSVAINGSDPNTLPEPASGPDGGGGTAPGGTAIGVNSTTPPDLGSQASNTTNPVADTGVNQPIDSGQGNDTTSSTGPGAHQPRSSANSSPATATSHSLTVMLMSGILLLFMI